MGRTSYQLITATIFGAVAVMHLVRAVLAIPVQIGDAAVPVGASWVGLVVAGAIAIWGFRLTRGAER